MSRSVSSASRELLAGDRTGENRGGGECGGGEKCGA